MVKKRKKIFPFCINDKSYGDLHYIAIKTGLSMSFIINLALADFLPKQIEILDSLED